MLCLGSHTLNQCSTAVKCYKSGRDSYGTAIHSSRSEIFRSQNRSGIENYRQRPNEAATVHRAPAAICISTCESVNDRTCRKPFLSKYLALEMVEASEHMLLYMNNRIRSSSRLSCRKNWTLQHTKGDIP